MVKVKNIKVYETKFESDNKNFQECLRYVKMMTPDYKTVMPKNPKQSVSFELTDASSALANCIRRYLIDEIPSYSMDVDEENIKTDDRFILTDFLKKNIEMVPFTQDISDGDVANITLSLSIENTTDDIIDVYTRDLIIHNKTKKLEISDYLTTTISLIKLRPATKLDITNIKLVKGIGKENSGKFSPLANISYEILDVEPVVENKFSKKGESSLNSSPSHFRIGFTTHRNRKAKDIMTLFCELIINTITGILSDVKKIKETDKIYLSKLITLETKGDVKYFHLKGEYWTIANIISKYCYIVYNDVQFVCSAVNHPLTEESTVKIRHNESVKLLHEALELIITDVNSVKKQFES